MKRQTEICNLNLQIDWLKTFVVSFLGTWDIVIPKCIENELIIALIQAYTFPFSIVTFLPNRQ
ncbi:hypothetical protein [Zobellia roscoffensis]|uniref:hypothetical protein n=1 Tax=Zobellia roscoffensis TaxID=2779508 RepID=UPI00188A94BC|nr:hypothetical protein [Zobellia roscoffensis]